MRRSTSALTVAALGAALSAITLMAQQNPPEDGMDSSGVPTALSPMAASRGARYLVRNGWDYLKYQEYERALAFFREAEARKKELNDGERQALAQGIERARRGLREASNGATRSYAKSGPTRRPGALALARPAQAPGGPGSEVPARDPIQLASGSRVDAPEPPVMTPRIMLPPVPAALPATALEPTVAAPAPAQPQAPVQAPVADAPTDKAAALAAPPAAIPDPPAPANAPILLAAGPAPGPSPIPAAPAPTATQGTAPASLPEPTALATAPPRVPSTPESDSVALPPLSSEPAGSPPAPPAEEAPAPPAPAPEPTTPASSPESATPKPESLPPLPEMPEPPPVGSPSAETETPPPVPVSEVSAPSASPSEPVPTPAPIRGGEAPTAPPEAMVERPSASNAAPLEAAPTTMPPVPALAPTPGSDSGRSADNFIPDRSAPLPSTLTPELQREVDQIAQRQEEELRRGGAPGAGAGLSPGLGGTAGGVSGNPSTRLEITRAPSPTEARPIRAIPVPDEFVPLPRRDWAPNRKYWSAAATCHMPLYFQDAALERYGHSTEQFFGPIGRYLSYPVDDPRQSIQRNQITQPIFSIGLFAAQIALLPYNLVMDPPWEAEYDLGYYRPSDRIPTDLYYLPLTGVGPPLRGKRY